MGELGATYQQRLFNDDELALSLHDRINRWADLRLKDDPKIFLEAVGVPIADSETGQISSWGKRKTLFEDGEYFGEFNRSGAFLAGRVAGEKPAAFKVDLSKSVWEYPITTERKSVVGFVDLAVHVSVRNLVMSVSRHPARLGDNDSVHLSGLIRSIGRSFAFDGENLWVDGKVHSADDMRLEVPKGYVGLFGTADSAFLLRSAHWMSENYDVERFTLLLETKTKIRSAGELLRQIRLYRTHKRDAKFVVCAPSDQLEPELRKILEEQEVGVVPYLSN